MQHDGYGEFGVADIVAATIVGLAATYASRRRRRPSSSKPAKDHDDVVPRLDRTQSGHLAKLERFSNYVARQMGFKDESECPQLSKLAIEYLKRSKGCEENIYEFFASEEDAESLREKLVEELERSILSYFAFHWSQASSMINQVLSTETEEKAKFKGFVLAATRKQRFERVTEDLKVTRVFSTLVNEMKVIGGSVHKGDECVDVMVPVALSERSPVLLFMGGGMGAGKSTVLKDILKQPFWAEAAANAVVVEADAFKETDVIYKALNSKGRHGDMLQTAELVHQSSTDAASSVLVTALNEGRDVIMDGTLAWEPFVNQTIEMVRNVHKSRYRMGVGYKVASDGTITENYWERIPDGEEGEEEGEHGNDLNRKPYRIELVGVVCDAYLAVIRGIRRAIITGRAVRVNSQLKSHKRFAEAFPRYCQLVDNARLYCTNATGGSPSLMAWKDGGNKLLVDPEEIKWLTALSKLNPDAESIYELYPDPSPIYEPGSVWNGVLLSPSRASLLSELMAVVKKVEDQKR
ncbi:calmodulin calcium-dependent NAD kinase-like isoform X1 [Syzygium oleosum]|uniref:calmodulin calcium-dependent NAD kinase-like isoform X1 n=1 Tax=Syzygium oleosum TaxID=219896 RepID=UPI0011D25422|nr:calmodulin calcium-dependent NAD kinase-like isoform X1 [Syzygium oleosum]